MHRDIAVASPAHLSLDGFLAERKLRGDLLVGVALRSQPQDADLRRGQRIVGGMLGELERHVG